jgi:hypothetical protein
LSKFFGPVVDVGAEGVVGIEIFASWSSGAVESGVAEGTGGVFGEGERANAVPCNLLETVGREGKSE